MNSLLSDPLPSTFDIEAPAAWRTTARGLRYDGSFAQVVEETVQTPSRPEGVHWTVVRRKPAVIVAARTVGGKWLMIRQERIAIQEAIWEFPAGQIDGDAERNPDLITDTVWRELAEETGWQRGSETVLTSLGHFYASAGFTDEKGHLFLAENVVPPAPGFHVDASEGILECAAFSTAKVRAMIAAGEIRDANSLAIFARMAARGLLEL